MGRWCRGTSSSPQGQSLSELLRVRGEGSGETQQGGGGGEE